MIDHHVQDVHDISITIYIIFYSFTLIKRLGLV